MTTRLRLEEMVKNFLPQIKYVRIYSPGNNQMIVYAMDEDFYLPETLKEQLNDFIQEIKPATVEYTIKHYFMQREDKVPPVSDPPQEIKELAMGNELNLKSIRKAVNVAFPFLKLQRITLEDDVIKFHLSEEVKLTLIEKLWFEEYLYELVPLNLKPKIIAREWTQVEE